uniref:NR LBD domain-containing protein n=1 Tax=Heterorhabditis bacteriophora TaxID=37862 RepID=A0A1I7W835_HETBA
MAEMSCMKATLLFNPDTPSIQEQIKIETIQEKIQGALDDYCRSHKAHQDIFKEENFYLVCYVPNLVRVIAMREQLLLYMIIDPMNISAITVGLRSTREAHPLRI